MAAVPSVAWHKTVARRLLPAGAFTRPLAVEVVCARQDVRGTPSEEKAKLWVGLLGLDWCDRIEFESGDASLTFLGTRSKAPVLPFAEALVQVSNEHFFS